MNAGNMMLSLLYTMAIKTNHRTPFQVWLEDSMKKLKIFTVFSMSWEQN